MSTEKIIEVKSLTKQFSRIRAVDNLDLNVYQGDVFGFLGPNGAGKSTTIRMLLTLIKPTSGMISLFGKPLNQHRSEILRRVGAIVEKPDFYLNLTAKKNLELLGKISGADVSSANIMKILELVGLEKRYDSRVKTFSHGMKQRLGIAQALLHQPDLIILDEPTTGLDPQGIKEIRDLIIHLSRDLGKTIFLSSHILSEIEIIATRMIIINKGTTVVEGTVDELLNSGILKVTFEVEEPAAAAELLRQSEWKDKLADVSNNVISMTLSKSETAAVNRYLVEKGITVGAVIPIRSLEQYFLEITQGEK
ncbi:MAG: ABC transporter ATP-binding protein [Bacteroidota bacterium]